MTQLYTGGLSCVIGSFLAPPSPAPNGSPRSRSTAPRRKGGGSPDNRICSVQGGQGDMCVRRPRHVVCSRRRERVDQEGKDGEGRWEGAPEGVGEERKGSGGSGRKPESRERVAARGRQTGFLIPSRDKINGYLQTGGKAGGTQAERRSRRRGIPNTTHRSAGLNPIAEIRGGK